ncbi:MAG: efflux RND transporter periplasmic adaptor subunit [bacterium]|nr:efflux RND transporter periplasmic adaptor subunit [bacterium]
MKHNKKRPRGASSNGKVWSGAVLLVLTAPAAVFFWQREAVPAEVAFETAHVGRDTLSRTVVATGVIRPVVGAEIDVGSRVSGTVIDLPVKVGDAVAAGELLAQLDATELDALIEQAKAEIAVAQAELAQAQSDFDRSRRLAAEGILPPADLELADRELEVARARAVNREARLRVAEINRAYTRIAAPIRGVIAAVTTREGETVTASFAAPTFVTIIDLDRLEVRAFVDETDIGRVFVGQSATFTVDTYPEAEFAADVTAIEPKAEIESSVVNYVVILAFENHEDTVLRPEMTAHVRIELERRQDALSVPRAALRRRDGRQYVSVRRAGVWAEQEVRTGWRTDRTIEILEGLAEGETVRINPS